ncbi:pheromone processing endoprotease [Serendipita sp. 400]|nr:pheromone processing endoprotease [Serendipita sp. 400]
MAMGTQLPSIAKSSLDLSLMRILHLLFLVASQALLVASFRPTKRYYDTHDYFVLHHNPDHGLSIEDSVALLPGAEFVERVGDITHHYLVRFEKLVLYSSEDSEAAATPVRRQHDLAIYPSIRSLSLQIPKQRFKRAPIPKFPTVNEVESALDIHDPIFPEQWHIINTENPEHMVNVTGLWKEGITGKGVVSALIDDGLDYTSRDLAQNFFAPGSHDFNDHGDLPMPRLSDDTHGTRCAGEIAAAKNDVCGVGLAYESKVAGIRILSGPITDVDEALAVNFGYQQNHIYSCSWGPPDDGKSMDAPNLLVTKAMLNGINKGRGGKGSVFVFASGNGAASDDSCNFDGYTNSIWTVTVGAIDSTGLRPYYSEACAANLVVTYSSGSGKSIVTTDIGVDKCYHYHGGTSAAAPLAVGVLALALSVRPDLTWRDIQHLCVLTSVRINLEDPDWEMTAAGRHYSYKYGYGKLDAYALVTLARTWTLVKPQAWLELQTIEFEDARMENNEMLGGEQIPPGGIRSSTTVTQEMLEDHSFDKLEHITVKVWIRHTRRGDVEAEIVSPAGIKSILAPKRQYDDATTGFVGWTFMSVKHWGENPVGKWTIRVSDQSNQHTGYFLGWSMTLWGSSTDPDYSKKFELADDPNEGHNLPPHPTSTSTTIKQLPKPTLHSESRSVVPSSTASPSDDDIVGEVYGALAEHSWIVGAVGMVIAIAIGIGIFVYRRRKTTAAYQPVPEDTMTMRPMGMGASSGDLPRDQTMEEGRPIAGDLRHSLDAGSDEDDADERSALTGTHPAPAYKDEPDERPTNR